MQQRHDPFASLGTDLLTPSNTVVALAAVSSSLRAKVKFDYTSQASNQITIKAGWEIDVVTLGQAGGWTKGRDLSGSYGCLV
jgi:hypothetical protein